MKRMGLLLITLSFGSLWCGDTFGTLSADTKHKIVSLEAINFHQLDLIKTSPLKNGGKRKVYKDVQHSLYYKIWSAGYSRVDDFVRALSDGVYDEITSLVAVICDKNSQVRGYVTKAGIPVYDASLDVLIKKVPGTLGGKPYTFKFFADFEQQTCQKFKNFYQKLLNVADEKGYFFFDLQPFNVVLVDGEYKLIDLEAVAQLVDLRDEFYTTFYNPKDYRQAIQKLKLKRVQRFGA